MPRWMIGALIPVVAMSAGSLIEMRVAIARLETSVADMDRRVVHIEQKLDRNELAEFSQ